MFISKRDGICVTSVALASMLLLAGCSRQEPAPAASTQMEGPVAVRAQGPAATPAPTPKPLATVESEYQGVSVSVQELRRDTNAATVTLKMTINNQSSDYFGVEKFGTVYDSSSTIAGVELIDLANKKKYFVVRDTDGTCLCSHGLDILHSGSKLAVWAKFPAPPDDVQKITVAIPHCPMLEDLPISR